MLHLDVVVVVAAAAAGVVVVELFADLWLLASKYLLSPLTQLPRQMDHLRGKLELVKDVGELAEQVPSTLGH